MPSSVKLCAALLLAALLSACQCGSSAPASPARPLAVEAEAGPGAAAESHAPVPPGPTASITLPEWLLRPLTPAERLILERYLPTRLLWEVHERRYTDPERLERVAWRDEQHPSVPTLPPAQLSVALHLGEPPPAPGLPRLGVRRLVLPLTPQPYSTDLSSQLQLDLGAGLSLSISEQSTDLKRTATQRALSDVLYELSLALEYQRDITTLGYSTSLSDWRTGSPELNVYDGYQTGIYRVEGWVNPGEEGTCFLKVFLAGPIPGLKGQLRLPIQLHGRIGAPLSPDTTESRTRRLVGYSRTPSQLFHYQSEVTLYEGGWSSRYSARFELWFRPRGGGPERRLAQATYVVSGWQR